MLQDYTFWSWVRDPRHCFRFLNFDISSQILILVYSFCFFIPDFDFRLFVTHLQTFKNVSIWNWFRDVFWTFLNVLGATFSVYGRCNPQYCERSTMLFLWSMLYRTRTANRSECQWQCNPIATRDMSSYFKTPNGNKLWIPCRFEGRWVYLNWHIENKDRNSYDSKRTPLKTSDVFRSFQKSFLSTKFVYSEASEIEKRFWTFSNVLGGNVFFDFFRIWAV